MRAARDGQAGEDPDFMPVPAHLVVEVLAPDDRYGDVDVKVKDYLVAGFGTVWVANPSWRHVLVYRADRRVQLLTEHDEITGGDALPTFRCRVGEFFNP